MASSRMYSGQWVDLLEPFPPDITTTRPNLRDLTRSRVWQLSGAHRVRPSSCNAFHQDCGRPPPPSIAPPPGTHCCVLSSSLRQTMATATATAMATPPLPPATSPDNDRACGAPLRPRDSPSSRQSERNPRAPTSASRELSGRGGTCSDATWPVSDKEITSHIRSISCVPTRPLRTPLRNVAARRASPLAPALLRPTVDGAAPLSAAADDEGTTTGTS
jgi:hypothetical protein